MRCLVCHDYTEQPEGSYCQAHERAFENLQKAFKKWETGYGSLTTLDFLKRIEKRPETGEKAKELARFFIENPSSWT